MTTDNPFFRLYDKLAVQLVDPIPSHQSRRGIISTNLSTSVGDFDGGYSGMIGDLFERAKFYFGNKNYAYNFADWCQDYSNEEILFVIEKAGLLLEERRRPDTGQELNPFIRALEILEDPRAKFGWNSRGELHIEVSMSFCNDYGLLPPGYGKTKELHLATLISEMCRQKDSHLSIDASINMVVEALKKFDPQVQLEAGKKFWGMYSVFEIMPFDFEDIKAIIKIAAEMFEEIKTEINSTTEASYVGPIKPGEQLELVENYHG